MPLDKVHVIEICRGFIGRLGPIIPGFVEAESELVDSYDRQTSEASSGQQFANPTPELLQQYASVFQANLKIKQGLVADTKDLAALHPLFINDHRD